MTRNAGYDDVPAEYAALRDCWLNARRAAFLEERLGGAGVPPRTILEIGSGTGWLVRGLAVSFPDSRVIGVEPIPAYVTFARDHAIRANETYLEGVAEALPAGLPATVDVVLTNDVLHHVDEWSRCISEVTRVTAPGARWIAIEPNSANPYTLVRQSLKAGERPFWAGAFLRAVCAASWELVARTHLFAIPPGIKNPPAILKELERRVERVPFLAGGVALELRRR